jgi:hypothetical protein
MKEVFDKDSWSNIDHEIYRTYVFPTNKITIHKPILLKISKNGGHRILDADNISHYIAPGWIHVFWETNDNVAFRF